VGALATIIGAISDDVVSALAAAGYPALTQDAAGNEGRILVGTAALYENVSAPRIIFEPIGSKFKGAEYASNSTTIGTTERRNQNALRTVAAEDVMFNVRCWGASPTGDATDDYDVTRALYHQIRASLQSLIPGAFEIEESGKYTTSANVNRSGREFVFGLTLFTPVLSGLVPYGASNGTPADIAAIVETLYAPPGVAGVGADFLVLPDGSGSTEPGCT
jgi:hypothetical protein